MKSAQGKRSAARRSPGKNDQTDVERRINRMLTQLIVSAAIFLLVFAGGGLIPSRVFDVFASVRAAITEDGHLLASVQSLGDAVAAGEDWSRAVREWCVDTFLPTVPTREPEWDAGRYLEGGKAYRGRLLPVIPDTPGSGTGGAAA